MSYPAWPETLPEPMADGFGHAGAQPVRRQPMESGPDRVTRISSTTVVTNSYSICISEKQLAEFWSFYENSANGGADWVRVPMFTGNTLVLHVCRFVTYPAIIPYGIAWRVTFTLETGEQHIDWS